ncbi:MAG: phenylalanine--tRNA ligase subunit beta [Hyphomicrobiaceae bacterium]|nr:phenylalanine--tRNA ligase subunit beta [Hyphomicrobiaceae bacterium]MCC0024019.1 phenylalanine--tRNA ligase subunit beta [Hyphomicrobiaceae bacterium]
MKFTVEWLKDHLETDASVAEIVDALTVTGTEVEAVEDQSALYKGFVIADVLSAKRHPNADKLQVCMVDFGAGQPVQVVCGAPNARAGMKGVFAPAGTFIPGSDFTLTKGNIRGEESNGMLCSERELLLSDDHTGIIDLPADAPTGEDFARYRHLDNVVIEVEITPNRGDCASVRGLARELAAAGLGKLKPLDIRDVPSQGPSPIPPLEHRFAEGEPKTVRKFCGRLIKGVKNGPSPEWLQNRLRAIGLRPINALADITNLISYDLGRPLHAYDPDKVVGTMHLRNAKKGETLDGLDNQDHELDETMCVIADDQGPLCLGGILGGNRSGCTDETVNVFMESAAWDPGLIAATGRKTGIISDARYRFERSVDPALTEPGLELATKWVLELCGGTPMEPVSSGEEAIPEITISFPLAEVKRLTGLDVSEAEMKAALTLLGFWVVGQGDVVKVAVPSWRPDVLTKTDLVEEVMRIVGVDKVPVEPLPRLNAVAKRMLTPIQKRRNLARRALAARGLDEAVTWSFVSEDLARRFGGGAEPLRLSNPIASDLSDMRPSLLPGLLMASQRNANRGFGDLGLFEVGQVFKTDAPDGQRNYATAIRTGTYEFEGAGRHWQKNADKVDVFDAKADLAAVLDVIGMDIDKVQLSDEAPDWAHPGRGGRIQLGPKNVIGWFGEIHPSLMADLGLKGPIVAIEMDLDAIPDPKSKGVKAKPALVASDLMPLSRDFAFVVDADVPAATVLKAAGSADKTLISDINLFDVFEAEHVGAGKKSVAIEVTLQPRGKTLTDEEIDAVSKALVAAVEKATGGVLRT